MSGEIRLRANLINKLTVWLKGKRLAQTGGPSLGEGEAVEKSD
jgi:hypothetical protein